MPTLSMFYGLIIEMYYDRNSQRWVARKLGFVYER